MCSACITSSPRGVEQRGRAVAALLDVRRVGRADQHRAHLVAGGAQRADQDLERDRVERRAQLIGLAPRTIGPGVVDLRAASRAAAPGSPRAARTRTGPRPRSRPAGSPRSTSASSHSPPKRARRRVALEPLARAARGPRLRAGLDQRQADVDQLDLGIGVAVAVAALVLGGEALGELARARALAGLDRELERLAAVAQLVGDLGRARRSRPSAERLAQRRAPRRRSARRSASSPRSITVRAVSRRRSEASSPSAESTPLARGQRIRSIPSSSAIAAACIGPAPPNGISAKPRGSTPRSTVTTRSARTISWLATRTMPSAASSGSSPSSSASRADRALGRVARRARRRRRAPTTGRGSRASGWRR